MFNTASWQSHKEYQTIVRNSKARFNSDSRSLFRGQLEGIYRKLDALDLDLVGFALRQYYPSSGRPAIHQAQILRSLILFTLLLGKTSAKLSFSSWVRDVLPYEPAFIALVGCSSPYELPPLGSYFDFINRFWRGAKDIYHRRSSFPAGKNSKSFPKEIGPDGKLVDKSASVKADQLVRLFLEDKPLTDNPESVFQDIFFLSCVLPSLNKGIIPLDNLTVSGDGTAVISHSAPGGHKLRNAKPEEENLRHYSDPDADFGYDSCKKVTYFGRTLYLLCCRNDHFMVEVPLTFKFTSAKRHDSLNFLYTFDELLKHSYSVNPHNICLDSAHDNAATYVLLDHLGINALIDINGRTKSMEGAPNDISMDKDAKPHCRAGHCMVSVGNDPVKDAHKYRCPLRLGKVKECPYEAECSPTAYGRTVYIHNHSDLRFNTGIPRGSDEYKDIYRQRTACERINNRVLNDYMLQSMKIHGTMRFSFWMMLIGICIHLDAWMKAGVI